MSKETEGKATEGKRKSLVEVLETDYEDRDEAVLLLEKCWALKQRKEQVDAEYDEVKEDLSAMQKLSGLDGLRHNNIAFVVSHREGRETLDSKAAMEALVANGVRPELVRQCFEAAVKKGQGYYVRELVDLNQSKRGGGKKGGEWS